MKLNSLEFKNLVINEIKNLAKTENWQDESLISEKTLSVLSENEYDIVDFSSDIQPSIEDELIDIKEVNKLNEELKRMRQLVDFRNPFFEKNKL